jgi:hypothetical protein
VSVFGGAAIRRACRAELALACGDHVTGLRLHRESVASLRELRIPGVTMTGLEPWVLSGEAVALSAHARYAAGGDEAPGRALFESCRGKALLVFAATGPPLDYPAAGQVLFALGAWALLRGAGVAPDALRLLALADRFSYHRTIPTMMWERIGPAAEEAAPGLLAGFHAGYRDRPPQDLRAEARRLVGRLAG